MASMTLVRRGTISATSADGAGPKDSSAFTAVKTASSFCIPKIRERRQAVSVQRGSVSLTSSDTSPTNVTITSVDMTAAEVKITFKEKRAGNDNRGITAKLQAATTLRLQYDTIASGDTIDVEWEVVEKKPYKGATARIQSTTTVRLTWDGTLAVGETIDCDFEVYDLDDVADQMLETDYKVLRLLGFAGENSMQDLFTFDQAGNPTTFRIRTFDTKAHRLLATNNIPALDPLETGELSRSTVTLTWNVANNRTSLIVSELEQAVASTPGVS